MNTKKQWQDISSEEQLIVFDRPKHPFETLPNIG